MVTAADLAVGDISDLEVVNCENLDASEELSDN